MPTYCFRSRTTGKLHEVSMSFDELRKKTKATDGESMTIDGDLCDRSFRDEMGTGAFTPGNWPMTSMAAGCHPSQAAEFTKAAKDQGLNGVSWCKETGDARFESRSSRAAWMKAEGLYDKNGGYGDG